MKKQIEKAIRETLVVANPKGIQYAVERILRLFPDGCVCDNEDTTGTTSIDCCNQCGKPTEEFWIKK